MIKNQFPIKGKFYKVIKGPYAGFIGECVNVRFESPLPVILEDMGFNGKACRLDEIEENAKQPQGLDISNPEKN